MANGTTGLTPHTPGRRGRAGRRHAPPWLHYAATAAAVLTGTVARALLEPALGHHLPFGTFLAAVAFVAWLGGVGPGLTAVAGGALVGTYLFVEPADSFAIDDAGGAIEFAFFVVMGTAVSLLSESQRRAWDRATTATTEAGASAAAVRDVVDRTTDAVAVFDADWRYVHANDRAAALAGRPVAALIGRTLWEVSPTLAGTEYAARLAAAVEAATPDRFESYDAATDRWTETQVYPSLGNRNGSNGDAGPGAGGAADRRPGGATLFVADTTARHAAARTRAVLAAINEAARDVQDPAELMWAVVGTVGRMMAASRCLFADFESAGATATVLRDYADGVPSVAGAHGIADFGAFVVAEFAAGRTVVVTDVAADPRLTPAERRACADARVAAHVFVPLMRDGRPVALFGVHAASPRDWPPEDVALVEHAAARSWAAVEAARAARAVRDSEERLRLALDASRLGDWAWDVATDVRTFSARACEIFGRCGGCALSSAAFRELVHPDDRAAVDAAIDASLRGADCDLEYRVVYPDGTHRWIADRGRAFFDGPGGRPVRMLGVVQDVTDRVAHRDALARSEARFQAFMDNSPTSSWITDDDGTIVYASATYRDTFQTPAGDIVGRSVYDIAPAAIADAYMVNIRAVASTGTPAEAIEAAIRADGTPGQFLVYKFRLPEPGPGGRALVGGVAIDVTDRLAAEEAVRLHSRVLESMTEGVSVADESGHIVYTNSAEDRMFGYAPGELAGQHLTTLNAYPPDENARIVAGVIDQLARDGVWSGEWHNRRRDGTSFYTHAFISGLERDGRNYWVCVQRDVTAQRAAERVAAESRERLRMAADAARVGVFDWDAVADRALWENDRMYEIFGRNPADGPLSRAELAAVFHPDDLPAFDRAMDDAAHPGHELHVAVRVRRPDGAVRVVEYFGRFEHDPAGRPARLVGIVADVTDRATADADRERVLEAERAARADAERAGRMKDEFLATLSHELRTPLNAILGWSQLIRSGSLPPDELQHGLETVERNARVQTQLIDDLLDMSRIISGKVRLDVQRVNPADLVTAAVATVRPTADAKEIALQTQIDPALGAIAGDPNRLQQAVWNLLTNAIKFTPRGGRIRVTVRATGNAINRADAGAVNADRPLNAVDADDAVDANGLAKMADVGQVAVDAVEVTVSDNGQGIRPDFLPHVFDRFRQADATTTRRHGGLGLGLSIVKHLVEMHGGTVAAHSDGEGTGATFTIVLPLAPASPDPRPDAGFRRRAVGIEMPHRADGPTLAGLRVLVLDDEPDARDLVRRLLADRGADARTAETAADAVGMLAGEWSPDVIVSDIGMPVEDGYAFIRRVRARESATASPRTPAIALTAYARPEDRTRAILAGYQVHLTKPVEPAELLANVAGLAGRTGAAAEK